MILKRLAFYKSPIETMGFQASWVLVFLIKIIENPRQVSLFSFYFKSLERYSLFRLIGKFFYPLGRGVVWKIIRRLGQAKEKLHLITLKDFVKNKEIEKTGLIKASIVKTIAPHFISSGKIAFKKSDYPSERFPEIYVATIREATVIGHSNLSIVNNEIISHDLLAISTDLTPEEKHLKIYRHGNFFRLTHKIMTKKHEKLAEAASFVDGLSYNYAHWITEVLPRIVSFCSSNQYSHVPIVVDDKLHKNIMATLEKVVGRRIVYLLPRNQIVKIDKLYVTSVAGYIAYERRYKFIQPSSEGKFNAHAMRLLVSLLKPLNDNKQTPQRIYLRRNSGYRNLTNQNEIEALLTRHRFTIVDPAKLSFLEQVNYFSKAKVIIGPTGASFANLIFCNKKVNLAILVNNDTNMIYKYWVNLASIMDIQVNYITGKSKQFFGGIHRDFSVDLDLIDAYVKSITR
jgi:capsular polysaccharide biosynthesis protein